jgi:hypothetical protein
MALEISAGCNATITLSGQTVSGATTFRADLSADFFGQDQTIATSSTALDMGTVTAPKVLYIRNLDEANYVEIDSVTSFDNFPQKILPGASILLAPQTVTLFAKANTASVDIYVVTG